MREQLSVKELQNKCIDLKKHVVDMIYKAQSGHPGGSLSVAEFVTACYWHEMDVDPKNPRWPDRDRFVLSKGHVCPAQYAALAMKGFFPMETLDTLRKEGSPLQGHPSMNKCPGIDISTGSLGQGLACAVGMALAAKMDGKDYRVYCAVGDGEAQEGEIWEAANTAHKYQLDNLVVFVDFNNLQIDGTCDEVMPNGDLGAKFREFGFDTYEIDGNNMEQMVAALNLARAVNNGKPKCIYGHTVKGKGVSYMENVCSWHGVAPNEEQWKQAMDELDAQYVK
ncbi:MAG: transketolase [Oscillospiraceae bacterium]|jgi:transketolase|nr:transketolase [Oscillospiraceae bacterium]MBQ2606852.1 transketolase [Oscillospiraceae bacterium]MBQ5566627.1 transketolase [Oscillospiraceae bacterium]